MRIRFHADDADHAGSWYWRDGLEHLANKIDVVIGHEGLERHD